MVAPPVLAFVSNKYHVKSTVIELYQQSHSTMTLFLLVFPQVCENVKKHSLSLSLFLSLRLFQDISR
jgi:hypothetical protein